MFKTLFSRMLVTYLGVTLGLLLLLGVTLGVLFQNQYISEREEELYREAEEINSIVIEKYIDDDKRPVAKEELQTIARKYDALIQIQFTDSAFGRVEFMDALSADKWAGTEAVEISDVVETIIDQRPRPSITRHMYRDVLDIPIMSLSMAISDESGSNIGALLLHIDISSLTEAIKRVYIDLLIITLIAVILAFLAVVYITVRMTKPIVEMNNAVKRFTKGDYNARVRIRGADEVGQLGKSFNDMADAINNLEQSRKSFVANVSHELRSPLTSMRGFLEAIEDGTIPPEEQPHYLHIVIAENKRMSSMVNDLLDLARIESGQTVFKPERFDIHDLIVRTLITFEARITAKEIDVSVDFPQDRLYVWADQNQIAQVIRNLVDNAIKFTPDGGRLMVSTSTNRRMVVVRVQDSGQGIAPEDIPHVFDRFYKGEKAHTPTGAASTGLGLSIVKRIIEQHGQNIYVESRLHKGSAFIFTLKRQDEEPQQQSPGTKNSRGPKQRNGRGGRQGEKGKEEKAPQNE